MSKSLRIATLVTSVNSIAFAMPKAFEDAMRTGHASPMYRDKYPPYRIGWDDGRFVHEESEVRRDYANSENLLRSFLKKSKSGHVYLAVRFNIPLNLSVGFSNAKGWVLHPQDQGKLERDTPWIKLSARGQIGVDCNFDMNVVPSDLGIVTSVIRDTGKGATLDARTYLRTTNDIRQMVTGAGRTNERLEYDFPGYGQTYADLRYKPANAEICELSAYWYGNRIACAAELDDQIGEGRRALGLYDNRLVLVVPDPTEATNQLNLMLVKDHSTVQGVLLAAKRKFGCKAMCFGCVEGRSAGAVLVKDGNLQSLTSTDNQRDLKALFYAVFELPSAANFVDDEVEVTEQAEELTQVR